MCLKQHLSMLMQLCLRTSSLQKRLSSVVVSTSTWHPVIRGSILIRDYVSLAGHGSSVAGRHFRCPCIAHVLRMTHYAIGPFYLVSMLGEVKDPTCKCKCVTRVSCTPLEKNNSLNHSCVSPRMGCLAYITRPSFKQLKSCT